MRQGRFTLCSKQGTGVLEEELQAGSPEWGVLWLMGGYSSQCLTRISGLGEACKDSFFFFTNAFYLGNGETYSFVFPLLSC